MAKKKSIEDYFKAESSPYDTGGDINGVQITPLSVPTAVPESQYLNNVRIPVSTGYPVSNPVFEADQQHALALAARNAQAISKTPDMYQQAVSLDGREPAAIPVQYERSAPMNANEDVLSRISAINAANGFGGGTPSINGYRAPDQVVNGIPMSGGIPTQPTVDYPMGPTIEINRGASQDPDPQNGGPDRGGYPNRTRLPHNPNAWDGSPIVRDTAGNPVASGTGPFIGLPTQNPALRSPNGGGKGGAGGK